MEAVTSLSGQITQVKVSKNIEELNNEINQADWADMYQSLSKESQEIKPSLHDEDLKPLSSLWAYSKQRPLMML